MRDVPPPQRHAARSPVPAAFRPLWWLPGPHAQTLWGSLCRPWPRPAFHRQRLELPDGDFLDLDWSPGASDIERPLAVILHGLEGSSRSPYVRGLVRALEGLGIASLGMNFRGCGGQPNRLLRTYHSGETSDLAMVLAWLRLHWPWRPLAAAGFSLGGNVLLKYLGEAGLRSGLVAAAAICVPMDLAVCAERMERGLSRVYLRRLVAQLKTKLGFKYRRRASGLDLERLRRANGFREFDQLATAPLHGYAGADDYYARASSRSFIAGIETPTLIVHASDDPFMSDAVLPACGTLPASVHLEISRRGGHVGFVCGRGPLAALPRFWLDERIGRHLAGHLRPRAGAGAPDPAARAREAPTPPAPPSC